MDTQKNALRLLGELLLQIRGIAGDAGNLGHVSALGRGKFSHEDACRAIYALADAAHNIPDALAEPDRSGFLLPEAMEEVLSASIEVFGDHSTFGTFMPPGHHSKAAGFST